MQEGSKNKLDKKTMQRAIALCLLSPYVENFSFGEVNDEGKILREAICLFDITVLENTECEVIKQLWADLDEDFSIKELNRIRSFYRLSPNYISRVEDIDGSVLAQLLWVLNKRPLIVREYQNIEKAIQLCPEAKFVVLGEGIWREWMKDRSVFQNLFSLKSEEKLYETVMQVFTISLQGKTALSLREALGENEEFLRNITVNSLLEMIQSPRSIDGKKEVLPSPYIQRYLSLNVIDSKYLERVNLNTIVILNCADSSNTIKKPKEIKLTNVDDYLNDPECRSSDTPIFIINKNLCSDSEFEEICSKTSESTTVHYFKLLSDNNLEWIRSKGDVGELQNHKLDSHSKDETEFWSCTLNKSINLITGDPGMGKSILMKSLKNQCSSKHWTIIINPQDVNLFFKQSEACATSDYINLFQTFIFEKKHVSLGRLDKEFFKICSEQLRVYYVWDALDEISTKNLELVSDLIVRLSKEGFTQCVTSRKHLRSFLEKKFNTLSFSINQFNEQEQEDYIRKRLNPVVSEDNVEESIRKVKSSFASIKHIDILGIPLQIFMLTELVLQNSEKYLKLFGGSWLLTDLYHYFIEEKFKIFYEGKLCLDSQHFHLKRIFARDKDITLTHYEKLAVNLIFTDGADIRCKEDIDSTSHDYASIGIITGLQNNTPLFLHASFAEYLAAAHFSKNFEVIPGYKLFYQKYNNVRFFFDMLLAKNSPAHIAVLYRNFDALKSYDDKILKSKDDAGRNALHLICSWGKRHSRLKVKSSRINSNFSFFFSKRTLNVRYILEDYLFLGGQLDTREYQDGVLHLLNECGTEEPDVVFKMTPLLYARISESLGAELELLQSQQCHNGMSCTMYNHWDRINILFYSSVFGYNHAIKTVFNTTLSTSYDEINFSCEQSGFTALVIASFNGHKSVVESLLQHRTESNRANIYGRTQFYLASVNGHQRIVECLVRSGVDINLSCVRGLTPLYVASEKGHEKIVECLVKWGAEVNCTIEKGMTPLHVASINDHEKTVECLVNMGAKINCVNQYGRTPLMEAASYGQENTVQCLLKYGADINYVDYAGWTALDLAFSVFTNSHKRIVEFLVECGFKINR
ncbi:uncharacterized protein LOC135138848 [Zophobas morio]|uniref:uncharacterized protein LOC135138848 n=1 Tax=Zophobas morio TaxID=2755281 RepID=UPI0030827F18